MSTSVTITVKKLPQLACAAATIVTLGTIGLTYLMGGGYTVTGAAGLLALVAAGAKVANFCGVSATLQHKKSSDVD